MSHVHDNKSTDIILELIDVIADAVKDEDLDVHPLFEGVTLTVVELFASTVKKGICSSLEQMPHSEVLNDIVWHVCLLIW